MGDDMITGVILGPMGCLVGCIGVILLASALPFWVLQWIIAYF
jgi:hypothetical protein